MSDPNHYASMYERVRVKPCVVGDLSVEGLARTKHAVVERELSGLKDASTLDELKDVLLGATDRLKRLDVFDVIEMRLEAGKQGDDKDLADTTNVKVQIHESNMFKLHAGTYINANSEGSLETSLALKNYFGWAERIEGGLEFGSQHSNQYSLGITQPRIMDTYSQIQLRAFQATTNNQRHCSFTEAMRGGALSLLSDSGKHEVVLEGGWQEIYDRSRMASQLIRQQKGHKLRGVAKYVWRQTYMIESDEEDSLYATVGLRSETSVGVSPIGGAVGFAKQVLSGMVKLPLSETADLTFGAKIGLLRGLAGDASWHPSTCVSDRFFLGGVNSLRGFRTRGCGPTDERRPQTAMGAQPSVASEGGLDGQGPLDRDSLGGDLMCTLLAEFNFSLPHKFFQAFDIRGHIFANAGSTVLLSGVSEQPIKEQLEDFGKSFRFTVGGGIYLPTSLGRFEMNYCKILASSMYDRPKHGLQFGFMTDFI